MKKFSKVTMLLLAVMTAVSVFSLNVFANENTLPQSTFSTEITANRTIQTGVLPHRLQYKIVPMTAGEKNEFNRGILPNGLEYEIVPMTTDEMDAFNNGISTSSRSWTGDISVPAVGNSETNGAQLGGDFTIASDSTAVICVGNLPTATMPTVNIAAVTADQTSNGTLDDWILNVESNSKIYLHPSAVYTGGSYKVFVGTSELYSESVWLSISAE